MIMSLLSDGITTETHPAGDHKYSLLLLVQRARRGCKGSQCAAATINRRNYFNKIKITKNAMEPKKSVPKKYSFSLMCENYSNCCTMSILLKTK